MCRDEVIDDNFMSIIAEMTVMYYVHSRNRKKYAKYSEKTFELFCDAIRRYLIYPTLPKVNAQLSPEERFINWLLVDLNAEFGLGGDYGEYMANDLIITFFTERYWVGIYSVQKDINDYLFPEGYYNKLKRSL